MARRKSPPVPPSQVELDYREFGNALRKLIKAKGYTWGRLCRSYWCFLFFYDEYIKGRAPRVFARLFKDARCPWSFRPCGYE